MTIQTLRTHDALDAIRAELLYTRVRLQNDANAKDLAPSLVALIGQTDGAIKNQQLAWDAEVEADALVDASDDGLDDVVRDLADNLLFLVKDRSHARFTLYFDSKPANVIRLGLESELAKVKPWVQKLAGEAEPQLKSFGQALQSAISAGDAAIAARVKAQTDRATQRAREIQKLVDDANSARRSIYGVLVQRAEDKKLARDWPERFFKHATRSPKPAAGAAPSPTQPKA